MNNNKPSTLILYATNPQKTLLHRLKRQTGMSEDDYRAMIYDASNGRTDSSRQLYKYEAVSRQNLEELKETLKQLQTIKKKEGK